MYSQRYAAQIQAQLHIANLCGQKGQLRRVMERKAVVANAASVPLGFQEQARPVKRTEFPPSGS